MGGWDLFPPLGNASGTYDCSCEKDHFLNQLRPKVNLFQFFGDSGILKKRGKKETLSLNGRVEGGEENVLSAANVFTSCTLVNWLLGASHFHLQQH